MSLPAVEVLAPREVALGGMRAMTVRRTLPHMNRPLIGAWCFADHYGPTRVGVDGPPMDVAPHPHAGLQTVSWLFEGAIEHRDSGGVHAIVRPGEVNLMTGGSGIAHSEVSVPGTEVLHGVQLWVALPDEARHAARAFEHHVPEPVVVRAEHVAAGAGSAGAGTVRTDTTEGCTARVFLGSLTGSTSPVRTYSPLLGAELDLAAHAQLSLAVDPCFEHGVLLDSGSVSLQGVALGHGDLGCVDAGPTTLSLSAGPVGARILLLGGEPFTEQIVMWWNFVGRDHDEMVQFRADWETGSERFGVVEGYVGPRPRIPAPPMPIVRLKPRGRRPRRTRMGS